jgi:hypothetical protein
MVTELLANNITAIKEDEMVETGSTRGRLEMHFTVCLNICSPRVKRLLFNISVRPSCHRGVTSRVKIV